MSDSEDSDSNLSDLDQKAADKVARKAERNGKETVDLKGILNDVEETSVSWKDLVIKIFIMKNHVYFNIQNIFVNFTGIN